MDTDSSGLPVDSDSSGLPVESDSSGVIMDSDSSEDVDFYRSDAMPVLLPGSSSGDTPAGI